MSVIEKLINTYSELLDNLLLNYHNNINVEDSTKILNLKLDLED